MALTRKGGVDWESPIDDGEGGTIALHQWLGTVYQGHSDAEVAEILQKAGVNATKTAVRKARVRYDYPKTPGMARMDGSRPKPKANGPPVTIPDDEQVDAHTLFKEQIKAAIKNSDVTLSELSRRFDRSELTIKAMIDELMAEAFPIVTTETTVRLDTQTIPSIDVARQVPTPLAQMTGHYCAFGVMTDLHAGSVAQQITNTWAFVQCCYDAGIRFILVPGDLVAGHKVYRGQLNDLWAVGADKQLIVLNMSLPRLEGLTYLVIGGNHDFSYIKLGGPDIVKVFAASREDVVYLGYDVADVPLTDMASIRLWHMSGGRAYAISYKLQRAIEQYSFDELMKLIYGLKDNPSLRFVLAGHLHAAFWSIFGPITGMQCGCFEGSNSLTKRKGWHVVIGGFIVETWITDAGLVQRERIEWVPGIEIPNDYQGYPEILAAIGRTQVPDRVETLFSWGDEGGELDT